MNHGMRMLTAATCAVAIALFQGCGRQADSPGAVLAPEETADTIYVGGDIVTVNDALPTVEALATRDGLILAVGGRAAIESAHKGATTNIVDLGGKTLLPAFIDAHSHYVSALSAANQAKVYAPPAGPGKDVPGILAAIEQFRVEPRGSKGCIDTSLWLRRQRHARRPSAEPRRPGQGVPG